MQIHLMENRQSTGWTVFGGCWPRGEVSGSSFCLKNESGVPVPLQSEIAARWPDGSVKWSRHTASADLLERGGELLPGESPAFSGLALREEEDAWRVESEALELTVPKSGDLLARDCLCRGLSAFDAAYPVLLLSHVSEEEEEYSLRRRRLTCSIRARLPEAVGPLETVFRFDGVFLEEEQEKMPFRIRMTLRPDGEILFDHTFFFRGDPAADRLAGFGLRFETRLQGRPWQRHIRFLTDGDVYHDNPTQLFYWRRHLDPALLAAQQRGETVAETEELKEISEDLPLWDHFVFCQDSATHFSLRKKTREKGCCFLDAVQGRQAPGVLSLSDPHRSLSFFLRECREKHPAGLEVRGLSGERTEATVWFYAPQAEPFDFRHYDTRTYPMGNYEGFDYMRPDPNGIAVTCRVSLFPENGYTGDGELRRRSLQTRRPALYLADPAWYHDLRAFGFWSLPRRDTEVERWTEDQLEAAQSFFESEVEARSWYGLFNYGDFMHTYEASRHMWRFDVGGYAWDNTELTPTLWLWLQFMRTGSERVFRLAEALSRHTADVDMYHFGPMKGLGSRHNVRHWGCPCKEPRVSMAGHHRPLYYLTGDRRIGDCMEDSLSAAASLHAMPWYSREDGSVKLRTGPDWAALVSDWMTAFERTLDPRWRQMIQTGLADLDKAPLKLTSGPEFGFDPLTGGLRYEGEAQSGSMHLQACMGGTEIWLEAAEALDLPELADLTAGNGLYFFLSPEERQKRSGGLLGNRQFGSPIYSAEMQAWAARQSGDERMARAIWRNLLSLLFSPEHPDGYRAVSVYGRRSDGSPLEELPWITTNFTAQWCLKVIVTGDLIPAFRPETMAELARELKEHPPENRLYGA